MAFDALVLDAYLRQSLVTVRSLGRRGLSVAAWDANHVPAFSSRWCQGVYVCQAYQGTWEYFDQLEQILEDTHVRVLIASHDGTLALLRRYRTRLEPLVHAALANESALAIAVDKGRTLNVARRLGINVPRHVMVRKVNDIEAAIKEIGLPAVAKPIESWQWWEPRGVRLASELVTTTDEARCAVAKLTAFGRPVLFQELILGRREAVNLFYANGEIHACFAQWAKRMNPPLGGESVLRQSIEVPSDIGDQAKQLIREIDLEGYSEVEFRRNNSGVPYLMEINPRLSASVEVAVRSGVDFPYMLFRWANGDAVTKANGYRKGIWMRHLGGDVATTVSSFHQRGRPGVTPPLQAIAAFFLSFFRPMYYDYFDWGDLSPAVKAVIEFMRSLL